jgi:hypothetical protein
MREYLINIPLTITINGPDSVTGLTDAALYQNGTLSSISLTVNQIASTPYWNITFTPTATGNYTICGFGLVQDRIQCVSKSLYVSLNNIEDVSLGSWNWDKTTGVLTLYRQNGTQLTEFNVQDTPSTASRELI